MGWSTWNTFECNINETLVQQSIEALATSPLVRFGYNYVLIDDCWTVCLDESGKEDDKPCLKAGPRGKDGRIQINPKKFPKGFKPLTDLAHTRGLKIGIYTSVSAVTCGGFTGSFQHEAVDAQAFADWGFDFVKHDTCGADYSVHDGSMQAAVVRMRDGLWEAGGGKMVYYLDSGNPTSPQRVFNPRQIHITDEQAKKKLATKPSELVWVWLGELPNQERGPHLFKSWFDIGDTFLSTLTNAHNQVRIAEYQTCGHFNMPGMLTVGQGAQTLGQYRAQFFLWAVLGAPLILGNDIRQISDAHLQILTASEILKVNQDSDCIQGSQARDVGSAETWIKPLSDGSFAVVLLNKGEAKTKLLVHFNDDGLGWGQGSDFFPADFDSAHVRDLYAQSDLGTFSDHFKADVPGNDAMIVKITPKKSENVQV
jgi:alpha-galactosidase